MSAPSRRLHDAERGGELLCLGCGATGDQFELRWQESRSGRDRIRADCKRCGAFVGFSTNTAEARSRIVGRQGGRTQTLWPLGGHGDPE